MQRFLGHQELKGCLCAGKQFAVLWTELDLTDGETDRTPAERTEEHVKGCPSSLQTEIHSERLTVCRSSRPGSHHRKLSPQIPPHISVQHTETHSLHIYSSYQSSGELAAFRGLRDNAERGKLM